MYGRACAPCHGDGDGRGPSAAGLQPPATDLGRGVFKFGWVVDGMPREEDLRRIIRDGLAGTAMTGWDLPDREMGPLVAYLRSLAPAAWAEGEGTPVTPPADPWAPDRLAAAVARGEEVYHGVAQCFSCHPAYVERSRVLALRGGAGLRDRLHDSIPPAPDPLSPGSAGSTPPDFTFHTLRSPRPATRSADLYRVIAAGVPGTAMATWEGALPPEDLWALAHYVESLGALRGSPAAATLRERLLAADVAPP